MGADLTTEAVGKRVIDADGKHTGLVRDVSSGVVSIEPDPGITETVKTTLGLGHSDRNAYPVGSRAIDTIATDGVYRTDVPEVLDD